MSDDLKLPTRARRYRLAGERPASGGTVAGFGSGDDHVDDLVAAYALGAVERGEGELVERHCRICARCDRLVADERRVVGLLPLAVPPAVPAPDIKLALFARIAQSQALGHAQAGSLSVRAVEPLAGSAGEGALLPPTLTIPASRPAMPAPAAVPPPKLAAERRPRARWVGSALTLPLLVGLVVTGAWGLQLRDQVAERSGQLDRLEESLANFGAFGSQSLPLEGEQGEGELRIGADEQEAVLRVQLNEPDANTSYRLLGLDRDGKLVPISELEVDDEGTGLTPIDLKRSIGEYRKLQVEARSDDGNGESSASVMSGRPNGPIGNEDPTANSAMPDS